MYLEISITPKLEGKKLLICIDESNEHEFNHLVGIINNYSKDSSKAEAIDLGENSFIIFEIPCDILTYQCRKLIFKNYKHKVQIKDEEDASYDFDISSDIDSLLS